ncbi:MAG: hypothetical protein FK733_09060 [Asgard group archaeon]|nr:hypothetical protein [Asgard group archaeon]
MTGQIPDEFLYKDERYAIAGISGGSLFNPEDFDLKPHSSCTACWRGYQAFFNVIENHLVIDTLYINIEETKILNNKKPKKLSKSSKDPYRSFFKFHYPGLMLKLNFSGTILLAKDFIDSMYVHMGFQKPIAYETVIELKFEKGKLIEAVDKSELYAKNREQDSSKGAQPETYENKDVKEWIGDTFSLDYDSEEE